MVIRHPKPEEYPEIQKLNHVAYRAYWGDERSDEEIVADLKADFGDNLDKYLGQHYFALTNEDEVMAKIYVNRLQSFFNGQTVLLGGIGGVATYAEYRKSGAIRQLMNQSIKDMYQRGYVLSYLYPFSHPFYRKFGYETHEVYAIYKLYVKSYSMRQTIVDGHWHMMKSKEDPNWSDVFDLYQTFASGLNLMVDRQEHNWNNYREKDPYHGKYFSYIFRDTDGMALASFSFESAGNNNVFQINDLAYRNLEGLKAILDFVLRFKSDYDELTMRLPLGLPLEQLVSDVPEIEVRTGMVRLINVEEVLKTLPVPYLQTAVTVNVQVEDPLIEENNRSFLLIFNPKTNETSVQKIAVGHAAVADAHIKLGIHAASVMLVGARSFDELHLAGVVEASGDKRLLSVLFPTRPNMQNDYY